LLLALTVTLVSGPLAGLAVAQSTASEPQSAAAAAAADTVIEDAVASKLFYAPTGRVLKRGEVYAAIDAFSLGVVRVGVTDRFSIGVGRPLWVNTTWITPKFQIYEDDRTAIATGVLHLFAPGLAWVVWATVSQQSDRATTPSRPGWAGSTARTMTACTSACRCSSSAASAA